MFAALRPVIAGAILLVLGAPAGAAAQGVTTAAPQKPTAAAPQKAGAPKVNINAAIFKDFQKRVDGYVALHKKLEDTLPKLPKQTSPEELDKHERALARLIQEGRTGAKPGDILTPAMQRAIRRLLRPIFAGKDGLQIKDEILDRESKGKVRLVVNGRYPDEVPVSTMPPRVLQALPPLPEELEYRFIRDSLILFDPHAHIIVDFMDRAFT
jgi:hypothetical protein